MSTFHHKWSHIFLSCLVLHCCILSSGLSLASPLTKIVGGAQAAILGRLPYQVWLKYNGHFLCGGTILSTTLILTAAHCTENRNASDFAVIAGDYDRSLPDDFRQKRYVKKIFMHENYSVKLLRVNYDIALIVLESPFQFNEHVQSIQLPMKNEEFVGNTLVSGWGVTQTTNPTPARTLKYVVLPLLKNSDCEWRYLWTISDVMFCAGQKGRASCQGDSGGPAVCKRKEVGKPDTIVLCGIVSYGLGCGNGFFPGVYTKVSKFIDWIDEKATKIVNCHNGSDEGMCPQYSTPCGNDFYYCSSEDKCIPRSWVCDGMSDCMSTFDEIGCPGNFHGFFCRPDKKYISMVHRCDGDQDCESGVDEEDCPNPVEEGTFGCSKGSFSWWCNII